MYFCLYMIRKFPLFSFQELVTLIKSKYTLSDFNELMGIISLDHHFYSRDEMVQLYRLLADSLEKINEQSNSVGLT